MKIVLVLMAALAFTACSKSVKTVSSGEYFTLKTGETVKVSSADVKVKVLEIGSSHQASGSDSVFCRAEVTYKGKTEEKTLEAGSFASYDEWNLRAEKVNPAIDISKANCVFIVAKTLG